MARRQAFFTPRAARRHKFECERADVASRAAYSQSTLRKDGVSRGMTSSIERGICTNSADCTWRCESAAHMYICTTRGIVRHLSSFRGEEMLNTPLQPRQTDVGSVIEI